MSKSKTGSDLIHDERIRQIIEEGYTSHHDLEHSYSEFIMAAISYLYSSLGDPGMAKRLWCWDDGSFKPTNTKCDLIKAGALIAAAIDRINSDSPRRCDILFNSGTPTKSGNYLTIRKSRIDGSESVSYNYYSIEKNNWQIELLDLSDIVAWKFMDDIDIKFN